MVWVLTHPQNGVLPRASQNAPRRAPRRIAACGARRAARATPSHPTSSEPISHPRHTRAYVPYKFRHTINKRLQPEPSRRAHPPTHAPAEPRPAQVGNRMRSPAVHGMRRGSERVLGKITAVGRSHAAARQRRRRTTHQTAVTKHPKTPTRGTSYGLPGRAEIQLRGDLSAGCTFARPKALNGFVFFGWPQKNKTQLN